MNYEFFQSLRFTFYPFLRFRLQMTMLSEFRKYQRLFFWQKTSPNDKEIFKVENKMPFSSSSKKKITNHKTTQTKFIAWKNWLIAKKIMTFWFSTRRNLDEKQFTRNFNSFWPLLVWWRNWIGEKVVFFQNHLEWTYCITTVQT